MMLPIVDRNFTRQLEQSETEALLSRLTAIGEKPGNPYGVDIQKFGNATAFMVKGMPGPYFNSVRGLESKDIHWIDEILRFYNERRVTCCIHLHPDALDHDGFKLLRDRGLYQYDFRSTLYGSSDVHRLFPQSESQIDIRELSRDEFNIFGEIYTQAFNMPSSYALAVGENNRVLHERDGWHFYFGIHK